MSDTHFDPKPSTLLVFGVLICSTWVGAVAGAIVGPR